MARLIFIGEKFAGRIYEFAVTMTTVGRGDHNTLTIHDASVSQSHCEISVYGPEVIVRDLGSSNGTFVNGERLHNEQRPLASGQTVKFGTVEARLELEPESSSNTATDITAIHSHARHMHEQQCEPKPPANKSMTLHAGTETPAADHTLMLPRLSEDEKKPGTAIPAAQLEKRPNRTAILLGATLATLALAVVLWLLFARS